MIQWENREKKCYHTGCLSGGGDPLWEKGLDKGPSRKLPPLILGPSSISGLLKVKKQCCGWVRAEGATARCKVRGKSRESRFAGRINLIKILRYLPEMLYFAAI